MAINKQDRFEIEGLNLGRVNYLFIVWVQSDVVICQQLLLQPHDLENVTISSPKCNMYFRKFWFKFISWFTSYRVNKISMVVAA